MLISVPSSESTPMKPPPSSPQQRKKLLVPTPAPFSNNSGSASGTGGQWQDRVFHNYLVDSTDHYTLLRNPSEQPTSPYLSLPKVPPPGMTSQQIGEFIFQEVDQNAQGVVSNSDLIAALQRHPELAEVLPPSSPPPPPSLTTSQQLNLSTHDETLNLFIRKIRSRNSKKISLSEFLSLLQDDDNDEEPEDEEQILQSHDPHHHHSHPHPTNEDHRYWESESVGQEAQQQNVWESSQDYPLNPNRISVRSDDILHNARGGGDSPQNLRVSRERDPTTPLTRSSYHSQSFPSSPHPNLPPAHLSASASHLKPPTADSHRPPLHKSYNDPLPSHEPKPEETMRSEKRFPSPPSELGTLMRIILEGWLEKKSSKLGIWQKVT